MQAIFHYCFSIFIRFIQLRSIVPECSLRLFVILVSRLLLQDQICCGFLTWDCYLGHIPLSNKTNSGNADGLSFHLQNDSWLSAWPLVHTHQTNLLSRRQHNTTMFAKKIPCVIWSVYNKCVCQAPVGSQLFLAAHSNKKGILILKSS